MRAEATALAVAIENERVEARLQVKFPLEAGAAGERQELGATREEDVLAVVNFDAVNFERRRAAAEQPATFEELDPMAELF